MGSLVFGPVKVVGEMTEIAEASMADNGNEPESSASSALSGWEIAIDLIDVIIWPLLIALALLLFREGISLLFLRLGAVVDHVRRVKFRDVEVEIDSEKMPVGDETALTKVTRAAAKDEAALRQWWQAQPEARGASFDDFLALPKYDTVRRRAVADLGL